MDLIESTNILLADAGYNNLRIGLHYTCSEYFKQDQYGQITFTGGTSINYVLAVFELVDSSENKEFPKVECSSDTWLGFLRNIQEEYGRKFMKEVGLDKLFFEPKHSSEWL